MDGLLSPLASLLARLHGGGPAELPLPAVPGLPGLPGLPALPGLTGAGGAGLPGAERLLGGDAAGLPSLPAAPGADFPQALLPPGLAQRVVTGSPLPPGPPPRPAPTAPPGSWSPTAPAPAPPVFGGSRPGGSAGTPGGPGGPGIGGPGRVPAPAPVAAPGSPTPGAPAAPTGRAPGGAPEGGRAAPPSLPGGAPPGGPGRGTVGAPVGGSAGAPGRPAGPPLASAPGAPPATPSAPRPGGSAVAAPSVPSGPAPTALRGGIGTTPAVPAGLPLPPGPLASLRQVASTLSAVAATPSPLPVPPAAGSPLFGVAGRGMPSAISAGLGPLSTPLRAAWAGSAAPGVAAGHPPSFGWPTASGVRGVNGSVPGVTASAAPAVTWSPTLPRHSTWSGWATAGAQLNPRALGPTVFGATATPSAAPPVIALATSGRLQSALLSGTAAVARSMAGPALAGFGLADRAPTLLQAPARFEARFTATPPASGMPPTAAAAEAARTPGSGSALRTGASAAAHLTHAPARPGALATSTQPAGRVTSGPSLGVPMAPVGITTERTATAARTPRIEGADAPMRARPEAGFAAPLAAAARAATGTATAATGQETAVPLQRRAVDEARTAEQWLRPQTTAASRAARPRPTEIDDTEHLRDDAQADHEPTEHDAPPPEDEATTEPPVAATTTQAEPTAAQLRASLVRSAQHTALRELALGRRVLLVLPQAEAARAALLWTDAHGRSQLRWFQAQWHAPQTAVVSWRARREQRGTGPTGWAWGTSEAGTPTVRWASQPAASPVELVLNEPLRLGQALGAQWSVWIVVLPSTEGAR